MRTTLAVLVLCAFASSTSAQIVLAPVNDPNLEQIRAHLAKATAGMTTAGRIDAIREFVYSHRDHAVGNAYDWNIPKILEMMWAFHLGKGPKPAIICGSDSLVMQSILDRFSIQSRLMGMFTDGGPNLSSHSFIEVFNFQAGAWEAQDPTFGCGYVAAQDRRRLSIHDLLTMDLTAEVVPTSIRGDGWVANGVDHLRSVGYMELAVYHTRGLTTPTWMHWIVYNSARFDINKVFSNGLSWREWAATRYRGSPIVETSGS